MVSSSPYRRGKLIFVLGLYFKQYYTYIQIYITIYPKVGLLEVTKGGGKEGKKDNNNNEILSV
jgi:hypothetical protein